MAFFLHYAPTGDFEQGIFVPFNSQVEAERQAASDLMNGADQEFIEQIFEAEYITPKFGWTRRQLQDSSDIDLTPHLREENWSNKVTRKTILNHAEKHMDDMYQEMVKAQEDYLLEMNEAIKNGSWPGIKNSVPGNAYCWITGGVTTATPAALSAATAKTVVLILSAAVNQPAITEIGVSFDGVTASAIPVLVELVSGTAGTAGTPRTTLAAGKQIRGWPASTSQTTAGDTYSAEPTTQLVNRKWFVSPNGGLFVEQFPLGREPTGIITTATDAKTWSIRLTAPATVNAHAYIEFEE